MVNPLVWLSRSDSISNAPRRRFRHWGDQTVSALEHLESRVLLCGTPNTAATITSPAYAQDLESQTYGFLGHLTGTITDSTPGHGGYTVQIDLNGDGNADDTVGFDPDPDPNVDGEAMPFAYRLNDPFSMATRTVAVKVIESGSHGPLDSGWQSVTYTPVNPDNDPFEIKFATFEVTSSGYGMTGNLKGEVKDFTRAYSNYRLDIDSDGDGVFEPTNWAGPSQSLDRGLTLYPGRSSFTIKVTETDIFGRTFVVTRGVSASSPGGSKNQAPVFGAPPAVTISHGSLGTAAPFGAAASDPNGDTLKYYVSAPLAPGYDTPGVSVDGNGQVTVSNAEVVRYHFERDGMYAFTVYADDGQGGTGVTAAIYDDWQYWIGRAEGYLDVWADDYRSDVIEASARAAEAALRSFRTFFGDLEGLDSIATAATAVIWATAPVSPTTAALGDAISGLALGLFQSGTGEDDSDFERKLAEEVNEAIEDSGDQLNAFRLTRDSDIDALASDLRINNGGLSPDALARLAYQKWAELTNELSLKTKAPSSDEIYGNMLFEYAQGNGMGVYVDGQTYSPTTCRWILTWKSEDTDYNPDIITPIDGGDIADELNRILYGSSQPM